jgi:hypothetical protein
MAWKEDPMAAASSKYGDGALLPMDMEMTSTPLAMAAFAAAPAQPAHPVDGEPGARHGAAGGAAGQPVEADSVTPPTARLATVDAVWLPWPWSSSGDRPTAARRRGRR